jgi:hypothetical protein
MSITPGAGTYLAVFSATVNATPVVADTVDFCIFANSIEQSHTARHFNHEFSIAGTERFPLLTHAVLTVSDSQAIEVRWKVTTATSHTGYCQRRTLTLIPVSASSTQVTATGDDTTSSTDFSVTLGSMTKAISQRSVLR